MIIFQKPGAELPWQIFTVDKMKDFGYTKVRYCK